MFSYYFKAYNYLQNKPITGKDCVMFVSDGQGNDEVPLG